MPHYLALTYALDDASDALTQLIYADMASTGQYAAYLSPYGDPITQALQPFLASTQALMVSPGNSNPADFGAHDNLFSPLNTADLTWTNLLSAVNSEAQAQAAATLGGSGVQGIQSLCMYSSSAVLVQAAADGVRAWVAAENARRGVGVDPIRVYADVTWSMNVTGTYLDYAATMSATCPNGVDVMVLQDGSDTDLNVALALTASQLKPKAAMGLSYQNQVVLAAASGKPLAAAVPLAGWLLSYPVNFPYAPTLSSKGGKLGNSYDAGYAQYFWNRGANVSVATPNIAYVYWAALDIVQAAITQSTSLNASDLRAGMMALNGQVAMLGLLNFSATNGVNVAALSLLRQMNASGAVSNLQTGSFEISYPYPWAWPSILQPGGDLQVSQSNALALVAVVVCVLGAWVGQIITEQSVFVRRKGGLWQAWLLVVALALGGVGVWCSQLLMASALSLTKPAGTTLSLSFSAEVAMLAWLPSVLLTWCGLLLCMADVDSGTVVDLTRSSALQRQLRQQREDKKKLAALSPSAHLTHLLHAFTWRTVLGGWLVTAAIILSRVTLWYVWVQDATWSSAGWAWAVTCLIDAALVPLSQLMFFHALRNRTFAVFLFAAVVMADWQVQLQGLTFAYEPGEQLLPAALRTANVSAGLLDLIVGILAALICLIFIGLQFSRMRLSRNGLTVQVATLEALINKQKAALQADASLIATLQTQLDHMARMTELISINSPLPTEYAFALAACTNYATFTGLLSSSTSPSPMLEAAAAAAAAGRAGGKDMSDGPSKTWTASVRTHKLSVRQSSDDLSADPETAATLREGPSTDTTQVVHLAARTSAVSLIRASAHRASGQAGAEVGSSRPLGLKSIGPSDAAPTSAAAAASADEEGSAPEPRRLSLMGAAAAIVTARSASPASQRPSIAPLPGDADPATRTSDDAPAVAASTWRAKETRRSSVSLSAQPASTTHGAQSWKSFEERLTSSLEQQLQLHRAGAGKAQRSSTVGRASKSGIGEAEGEGSAFDLHAPLLGKSTRADAAPQTMAAFLSHPVCVEVLKAALQQVHSVENLVFYLHVQRYKRLQSARLRRLLAACIHEQFVRADAPEQINLSTKMRDAVQAAVQGKGEDGCAAELFRDAEREVLTLMSDNVLRSLPAWHLRLCSWILAVVPTRALMGTDPATSPDDAPDRLEAENSVQSEALPSVKS